MCLILLKRRKQRKKITWTLAVILCLEQNSNISEICFLPPIADPLTETRLYVQRSHSRKMNTLIHKHKKKKKQIRSYKFSSSLSKRDHSKNTLEMTQEKVGLCNTKELCEVCELIVSRTPLICILFSFMDLGFDKSWEGPLFFFLNREYFWIYHLTLNVDLILSNQNRRRNF